jgi:DNA-binding NtrC family response regulator
MSKQVELLVVEDDIEQLGRYLECAKQLGIQVSGLPNLQSALDYFSRKSAEFLITDIHLTQNTGYSSFEGLKLIEHVRECSPETKVIAMSSDPKLETYQQAFRLGAMAFLKKPIVTADEIAVAMEAARKHSMLHHAAAFSLKCGGSEKTGALAADGVVFDPKERLKAQKLAQNRQVSILISGETGTGKEEYAKLIHRARCQMDGVVPLAVVNCANLEQTLAASTLFGHVKGAFTGAEKTSSGYIGEADGGFLFLDEIHCLTLDLQRRLLRVLNDGTYNRVGDTRVLKSDFQLICASTKNLEQEAEEGRFLLDLFMRIAGVNIELLPLRRRLADMPSFVALFLARENVAVPPAEFERIVAKCSGYYWQGNIRQLQKALTIMVLNASLDDSPVRAEFLPVMETMLPPKATEGEQLSVARILGSKGVPADAAEKLLAPLTGDCDFYDSIEYYERLILQTALTRHQKLPQVTKALNIPRTTLDDKRKKYGI